MSDLNGLGFVADPLDRLGYNREDADKVARLRRRKDARAILIARDMPILSRDGGALEPLLPIREIDALGGARVEALLGLLPDGAPVFAALMPDEAVEERE